MSRWSDYRRRRRVERRVRRGEGILVDTSPEAVQRRLDRAGAVCAVNTHLILRGRPERVR